MKANVHDRYSTGSRKLLETPFSPSDGTGTRGREEVLLPYPRLTTQKEINAHRVALQKLKRADIDAWILLDTVTERTRFWLNFVEHTFHQTEGREAIQNRLCKWGHIPQTSDRIYLLAETNADAPCYDITDYIQRCVEGDLSIADRLKGRTIFRSYQTEIQGYDLLSEQGVDALAHQVLNRYIHEFQDLIQQSVAGFCCVFPTFLSPLRVSETAIPWSDQFAKTLKPDLLAHLPLIRYETYDSATIRTLLWQRLTHQFAEVCVGGLREFAHQWGLQFAVNFPSTAKALEVDIATILKTADRPILNANKLATPKPFLIAKQITSCLEAPKGFSGQVSLCRSVSHSNLYVTDSTLGFNSWMRVEDSWQENRIHYNERFTARYFSQFLSIGMPKRSILILSPIGSLWTKPDSKGWNWLVKEWGWLCQAVWELGYDFDIASETGLTTAEVDKSARVLRLNGGDYSSVLLPSCLALQERTVEMLTRFIKARGRLIAMDPVPYLLNGRIGLDPYPLERLLYGWRTSILRGTTNQKIAALERLLHKYIKLPIQVYVKPDNTATRAITVQHRQSPDLNLFYLYNREKQPIETLIEIQRKLTVEEWNSSNGEKGALHHWHADEKTYTQLAFDRGQGRFIVARRNVSG